MGVVQNTVKDVLTSLTDEGVVDMDKIGSTNWFWSFPSKESAARRAKARAVADKVAELEKTLAALEAKKAQELVTRPPSEARSARLAQLAESTKVCFFSFEYLCSCVCRPLTWTLRGNT